MRQELIRKVVRVGNSAGVVLPREWLNGEAKVELIEKPIDIKGDVFRLLDEYLNYVLGIYLVGSYARGEETGRSDVDILVVTSSLNKKIEEGKYDLILISEKELGDVLERSALPILPMLREARPLLNTSLIESYKRTKLTRKNLRFHIELAKSALEINKSFIEMSKLEGMDVGDAVAYSLVLNLRTVYSIGCLRKNKKWNNREFVKLVRWVSGSNRANEGYLRVKDGRRKKGGFSVKEAEKLYLYISKKVKEVEKWLKGRKD